MHRILRAPAPLAVAAVTVLAACGDDPAGPATAEREAMPSAALADVVLALVLDAGTSQRTTTRSFPSSRVAAAGLEVDWDVAFEGPCPLGGSLAAQLEVHLTGDVDSGEGELRIDPPSSPGPVR